MASSRWKRFAFFEKHALSLPPEVLEDILPVNAEESGRNARNATSQCSLSVTTAALPHHTKPSVAGDALAPSGDDKKNAVVAMWSSLLQCSAPSTDSMANEPLMMPSQVQMAMPRSYKPHHSQDGSTTVVDGLVLAFCSSRNTELVHCVDVTQRCSSSMNEDLAAEDLDGWRGYFAPFGNQQETDIKIRGMDTCRAPSGGATTRPALYLAAISKHSVVVWEDPHLHLSCRRPLSSPDIPKDAHPLFVPLNDVECTAVAVAPQIAAVGTDHGSILVYAYQQTRSMTLFLRISSPPAPGLRVTSVKVATSGDSAMIFGLYGKDDDNPAASPAAVCCYELPLPSTTTAALSAPTARHDLDWRFVAADACVDSMGSTLTVARTDGLYSYSMTERTHIAPIDYSKLAICQIPPALPAEKVRDVDHDAVGFGFSLVASTDTKSGRDAVDIYDSTNKLVAFHLLLSPGHKTARAAGITTPPVVLPDGTAKSGRSSAIVLTSGGSIIALTERRTEDKIALLVQKHLYSAAIVVAYADPSYEAAMITDLYRRYADYLYRRGDFVGSIEQYMHTIGSLESSHVIYRFLDSPKIPLLVKYLEKLRERELSMPVHLELLRTCYLKLNDTKAADTIPTATSSVHKASYDFIMSTISSDPKVALSTICSLQAEQAAEMLAVHGAALARVLPQETAGVVLALSLGNYSPRALADAALSEVTDLDKMINVTDGSKAKECDPYPVATFASAFIEQPRMLRVILSTCNRNKCPLTPTLRRTLLELTLAEWNVAKRDGDTQAEKMRRKDAIASLTDSHCREIGDYDALVIVQLAGFEQGELILLERMQMTSMLIERYGRDGGEKSRRQMIAMCQRDPEVLADVLGYFVELASSRIAEIADGGDKANADSFDDDETEDILNDIQQTLALAKRQGALPPVRIARILAGEGAGQFHSHEAAGDGKAKAPRPTVPLSVTLDYAGSMLEDSRREIDRLLAEVVEYNELCGSMEAEIDTLLRASHGLPSKVDETDQNTIIDVEELYAKVEGQDDETTDGPIADDMREAFWREIRGSEDSFDVISRFFAKGVVK